MEVETARLVLRPWRDDDLPRYVELFSDPEVTRYTLPIPRERAEAFAMAFLRQWRHDGFGPFAAIDRHTRQWIGQIGLNRVTGWPGPDDIEVGFELSRRWWGRGLATEGARVSVRFGFEEVGLARIIGVTNPANGASRRVLTKAGLSYQGRCPFPPSLESAWYLIDRWAWDAGRSRDDC
jgi:ribosomal-protein-alanine N-acetyltransferase